MRRILAGLSAGLAVMAAHQKNWLLVVYWLAVEIYWIINAHKNER